MHTIIQILGLPLLACVIMSFILGYLGIHVLKREIIFIDIALAQIAAVGSIVAHLIFEAHGDSPAAYACSLACVLVAAAFYAFISNRIFQISLEAVIGISYAIAAAAALFLVGIAPGGHIHIHNILSGSILWANWQQIFIELFVFAAIGVCLYVFRKPIAEISHNHKGNTAKNSKAVFWDFIFYFLLGVVVTLSVQIGGIVIVFAYLIIPATISAAFSTKLILRLAIVWITATIGSLGGLLFSYCLDFSIGPAVSLILGIELVIVALTNKLRCLMCNQAKT